MKNNSIAKRSDSLPLKNSQEITQFLKILWDKIVENTGVANDEARNSFKSVLDIIKATGEIPHLGCLSVKNAASGEYRFIYFDSKLDNCLTMEEKQLLACVIIPTGTMSDENALSINMDRKINRPVAARKNVRDLCTIPSLALIPDVSPPMRRLLYDVRNHLLSTAKTGKENEKKRDLLFHKIASTVKKLDDHMKFIVKEGKYPPQLKNFPTAPVMPVINAQGINYLMKRFNISIQ